MKQKILISVGLLSITILAGLLMHNSVEARAKQKMLIPAYFYPGPVWDQAISGSSKVGAMIMNPGSGPGTFQDSNYVNVVKNAQAAGIKVIGYVHTSYSVRNIDLVKSEIDAYKEWYGVDGIFLDEVSISPSNLPYYQELSAYIRSDLADFVVLNPGTVPDEGYIAIADVVNVFEGTLAAYKDWVSPKWLDNYSADKFSNLVYGVDKVRDMKKAIRWSLKKHNSGYVYITNDVLVNPWDTLPKYWDNELSAI